MWLLDENIIYDRTTPALYKRSVYEKGVVQIVVEVGARFPLNLGGPAAEVLWNNLLVCCGQQAAAEKEFD